MTRFDSVDEVGAVEGSVVVVAAAWGAVLATGATINQCKCSGFQQRGEVVKKG